MTILWRASLAAIGLSVLWALLFASSNPPEGVGLLFGLGLIGAAVSGVILLVRRHRNRSHATL